MAITRQANNYTIRVENKYEAVVGGTLYKNANRMIVEASEGDLNLISNKKVISNGGC
ncbi:hypothetical protein [Aquimarina longa]|uniref:hypothetical protein n=1 Tax=Aquimarina longa TaxID=1080221 RepID=UPI000A5A1E20|nr:hypothetical protein [Aquimarina longa]